MTGFFPDVPERIAYGGLGSTDPYAYKVYEPDRLVLGKRMEEHLRIAVCFWHSFNWPGSDVFGSGTFDRPWLAGTSEPMTAARDKLEAAFAFLGHLGVPYFTFHDRDVAPEGHNLAETRANLDAIVDDIEGHMERTGTRLLWGTANLFSHPRYAAGAATNPDPEVFAHAAAQVSAMLDTTHRLGGANYVLWGGREGYETLLNTDLGREEAQLARFLHLVAEHKHRIGFGGTLLLEPKPQEPTKHQYDYDVATVDAFLGRHGLTDEYRVNIEANHATLAGHSFHHEISVAISRGLFGSIDMNRGDYQNGWDTDQFPNSVDELALALYEIVSAGGFTTGGFNFDAKLRDRASTATTCSTRTSEASTPSLEHCSSRPTSSRTGSWRACVTNDTADGTASSAARFSRAGSPSSTSGSAPCATTSIPRRARAGRSAWRTSSTSGSGQPAGTDASWPSSSA